MIASGALVVGAAPAVARADGVSEGMLQGVVTGEPMSGGPGLPDAPVPNVRVDVLQLDGTFYADTMTDKAGKYQMNVPFGRYTLTFEPVNSEYAPRNSRSGTGCSSYFGDELTVGSDSPSVTDDMRLLRGETITGSVVSAKTGWAIPDALVLVEPVGASCLPDPKGGFSESDGSYAVTGVPAGDYRLSIQASIYQYSYYSTRGTVSDPADATVHSAVGGGTFRADLPLAARPGFPEFSDVRGDPFLTNILYIESAGVTKGYPDGTYRPLGTVNRDAMAAFLYRISDTSGFTPPPTPSFSDVPPSSQFYKEIEWAKSVGITTGYPDGTYRPLDPVSRDAMAAFLFRSRDHRDFVPPSTPTFVDVTPASDQFYREIEWMADAGVSTGYPDKTYRGQNPVARNAMAAFLDRAFLSHGVG